MANPQKNAIGVVITLTILDEAGAVRNVSSATTKEIVFEKPDNTTVTKTATFTTNGTDGKIYYTTATNDLDLAGLWQIQARVAGTGYDIKSQLANMIVEGNAGE